MEQHTLSTMKMDGRGVFELVSREVPKNISETLEKAHMSADEVDLYILHQANVRLIEQVAKKLKQPEWAPDFGERAPHPTAGVTAIGCRMPLIAFNINLDTYNLEIGKKIVKAIRSATGGYSCIRAIALELEEKKQIQVSMNMINYEKTPRSYRLRAGSCYFTLLIFLSVDT